MEERAADKSGHMRTNAPSILWRIDPVIARVAQWADSDHWGWERPNLDPVIGSVLKERRMLARLTLMAVLLAGLAQAQDPDMELSEVILEDLKTDPAGYLLPLPPGAKVGFWWEHKLGPGSAVRYLVTAERDGLLVVERERDLGVAGTIVHAWLVDPSVDLSHGRVVGKPRPNNVRKAWVGIKGKNAHPVTVQKPPIHQEGEPRKIEESEAQIELAGKTWKATLMVEGEMRTWVANPQGFVLKCVIGEKVSTELVKIGTGATTSLVWD